MKNLLLLIFIFLNLFLSKEKKLIKNHKNKTHLDKKSNLNYNICNRKNFTNIVNKLLSIFEYIVSKLKKLFTFFIGKNEVIEVKSGKIYNLIQTLNKNNNNLKKSYSILKKQKLSLKKHLKSLIDLNPRNKKERDKKEKYIKLIYFKINKINKEIYLYKKYKKSNIKNKKEKKPTLRKNIISSINIFLGLSSIVLLLIKYFPIEDYFGTDHSEIEVKSLRNIDSIIGYDNEKSQIIPNIQTLSEMQKKYNKIITTNNEKQNMVIYGPEGSGKSAFIEASIKLQCKQNNQDKVNIFNISNATFLSCEDILSKAIASAEKKKEKKSFIIINDLETITTNIKNSNESHAIYIKFINKLKEIELKHPNLSLIFESKNNITNDNEIFNTINIKKTINIPYPDISSKYTIIKNFLNKYSEVSKVTRDQLIELIKSININSPSYMYLQSKTNEAIRNAFNKDDYITIDELKKVFITEDELSLNDVFSSLKDMKDLADALKEKNKINKNKTNLRPSSKKFKDIAGFSEAKNEVNDKIINIKKFSELAKKLKIDNTSKGILLHGPPGNGKSLFAEAIAGELGYPYERTEQSFTRLLVGSGEERVDKLFEDAKKNAKEHGGAVIIIDEADITCKKRYNQFNSSSSDGVTSTFLAKIDELNNEKSNVLIILTTNHKDKIDEAIIRAGRIEIDIEVNAPNEDDIYDLLKFFIKEYDVKTKDISDNDIKILSRKIYKNRKTINDKDLSTTTLIKDKDLSIALIQSKIKNININIFNKITKKYNNNWKNHTDEDLYVTLNDLYEIFNLKLEDSISSS